MDETSNLLTNTRLATTEQYTSVVASVDGRWDYPGQASPTCTEFSPLAGPANPTQERANDVAAPTTANSGLKYSVLFAAIGPDGSWVRMFGIYSQATKAVTSGPFSNRWPKSGMMRSGRLYRRPLLAHHTSANASGSWPTPQSRDWKGPQGRAYKGEAVDLPAAVQMWPTPCAGDFNSTEDLDQWAERRAKVKAKTKNGNGFGMPLGVAVRMWPTPTSRDWKDGTSTANVPVNSLLGRAVMPNKERGALTPMFCEWLQGYPVGWTELKP